MNHSPCTKWTWGVDPGTYGESNSTKLLHTWCRYFQPICSSVFSPRFCFCLFRQLVAVVIFFLVVSGSSVDLFRPPMGFCCTQVVGTLFTHSLRSWQLRLLLFGHCSLYLVRSIQWFLRSFFQIPLVFILQPRVDACFLACINET